MERYKKQEKKAKPKKKSKADLQHALHLLHQMVLIRQFEEKAAELYTSLKIRGFLHLYIGEEAVAVGVMEVLQQEDEVVATYREHGQALARGIPANSIMAEMYGKQEGCSRGRGGSMHLFDARRRFYGGNAIVGGGLPLAVGLALANKMQQKPHIICCFFGEGAIAEGEFHESLNLAVLWQLPVLFVCENNLYAMGTALERSESVTNLIDKSKGYGIEGSSVDGMDVLVVEDAAKNAVNYVRSQQKPYFLECRTYRFRAHSMFDAELYRSKSEVEEWKKKDPITTFIELMKEKQMITEDDIKEIEKEVKQEVQQAVDFAEQGTWEPAEDLTRFVYSEQEPK